jgi:hypothetical protein
VTGVRGRTRRALTARSYLARLAVVVGVLAGLVLANGMQCTDGMTAMALEHVASSSTMLGAAQDGAVAGVMAGVASHSPDDLTAAETAHQVTAVPHAAGVFAPVGDGSPGSHGLGGGLAACLVFIVAVVAGIVGLRPWLLRIFAAVLMFGRGRRVIRVVAPRAASLAELCLLRT